MIRHGRTSWPAARSSATVPRTNARQPLAGSDVVERERVLLAEVERARLDPVPGQRLRRDRHAAVDRERQREAVVVVGVLADQVHAAGAAGDDAAHAPSRARITRTASSLASISR